MDPRDPAAQGRQAVGPVGRPACGPVGQRSELSLALCDQELGGEVVLFHDRIVRL
jgi:hypothetical protein